jgi:hypothetical protein
VTAVSGTKFAPGRVRRVGEARHSTIIELPPGHPFAIGDLVRVEAADGDVVSGIIELRSALVVRVSCRLRTGQAARVLGRE